MDIRPAFFDNGEYTLYYGMGCEGTSCPNKIKFTVRPNTVSILWVVPQFIVITLGEVLLSVTGLEFAYSQSAPSMKSFLQAMWLLTVFMGNIIDMAISGTHIIPEPAMEFFFYALLMILTMAIFILLGKFFLISC
uniref:Neur_chan_memb domain-containing protein n=1 Tax=Angiostrongylus cantonensis TaxID=6313 RepID=A0A0K0D336_ANGCA